MTPDRCYSCGELIGDGGRTARGITLRGRGSRSFNSTVAPGVPTTEPCIQAEAEQKGEQR